MVCDSGSQLWDTLCGGAWGLSPVWDATVLSLGSAGHTGPVSSLWIDWMT